MFRILGIPCLWVPINEGSYFWGIKGIVSRCCSLCTSQRGSHATVRSSACFSWSSYIEQLFTEVEMNSGGYLLSLEEATAVNIHRYSPTLRWIIVLVYAKPVNSKRRKKEFYRSKLRWKDDCSRARPLCFANQWISQDILSLNSQSKRAKMDIHCFGVYWSGLL